MMESIPFLHANRVFNIFFVEDLAFSEVRSILDQLLKEDAFSFEIQANRQAYYIKVDHSSFQVWVSELDVIIERDPEDSN
jgi:hypothetical protein